MTTSNQTVAEQTKPTIGISEVLATSSLNPRTPPLPTRENTVLLLIDIQHLAEPSYHVKNAIAAGMDEHDVRAALADMRRASTLRSGMQAGFWTLHARQAFLPSM